MKREFFKIASDIIQYTTKGVDLLLESDELLQKAGSKEPRELEKLVRELSEKQKRAVECIQAATRMERALMLTQKRRIEALAKQI